MLRLLLRRIHSQSYKYNGLKNGYLLIAIPSAPLPQVVERRCISTNFTGNKIL